MKIMKDIVWLGTVAECEYMWQVQRHFDLMSYPAPIYQLRQLLNLDFII